MIGLLFLSFLGQSIFAQQLQSNTSLAKLLDAYYDEGLALTPLLATSRGDNRFNDKLPNTISIPYLKSVHDYNIKYQSLLAAFKNVKLSSADKISLAIAKNEKVKDEEK